MRKTLIVLALLVAAVALPVSGAAAKGKAQAHSGKKVAAGLCRGERKALGTKAFKAKYGKHAQRACLRANAAAAQTVLANAAKACTTEQADANFAAGHGGKTFAQFYGSNDSDSNAFGKCVSSKASDEVKAENKNMVNAAKACRAEQADANFAAGHGGRTFAEFYGTNHNRRNAFGKCVSSKAKAMNDGDDSDGPPQYKIPKPNHGKGPQDVS